MERNDGQAAKKTTGSEDEEDGHAALGSVVPVLLYVAHQADGKAKHSVHYAPLFSMPKRVYDESCCVSCVL